MQCEWPESPAKVSWLPGGNQSLETGERDVKFVGNVERAVPSI